MTFGIRDLSMIVVLVLTAGHAALADEFDQKPKDCTDPAKITPQIMYLCAEGDLIDADFFEILADDKVDEAMSTPDVTSPKIAGDDTSNDLTDQPKPNDGTAYIARDLVWRSGSDGAILVDGKLNIPVCWINPGKDAQRKKARRLVKLAVKKTWEKHAPILFTGWGRCARRQVGGVRIKVADIGPKALVGRSAGSSPISMWLNFTFRNFSRTCAQDDPKPDSIKWETCVYSIAVHEFGHILGYFHEHDRLFHGIEYHELDAAGLAQRKEECAARKVIKASRRKQPKDALFGMFDPKSVMNYCFSIYDHRVKLTELDIEGLTEAYPPPN